VTAYPKSTDDSPICVALAPEHASSLVLLFDRLRQAGVEDFFHPHPLTAEEAHARSKYSGLDFYCVITRDDNVIGYGMLRGWEEGYPIPSLGIALDPAVTGRGYGRMLMNFLHDTARKRGAAKVRLKVDPRNRAAIELYRSLGYVLEPQPDRQLIGFLDLTSTGSGKNG
jgi:[ribosomal protein S18]-alanine N-acetyltransferase